MRTWPQLQLRGDMESLRAEVARLKRSGVEAVAAYVRQKERCDEVRSRAMCVSIEWIDCRWGHAHRWRTPLFLFHTVDRPTERDVAQLTAALVELQARYDALRLNNTASTVRHPLVGPFLVHDLDRSTAQNYHLI